MRYELAGRRKRATGSSLFMLAVLLGVAAPRAASAGGSVMIDDFEEIEDAQILSSTLATTPQQSTLDHVSILGGERDAQVVVFSGGGTMTANTSDAAGHLSSSQPTGLRGRVILSWDGNDNDAGVVNPTGLGGVNLTAAPNDAFLLRIISADVAFQLRTRVLTDAANASEAFTAIAAGTANTTLSIPFSGFVTSSGTGANFGNVGAIVMTFNSAGTPAQSLNLVVEYLMVGETGTPVELLDFEVSR